MPVEVHQLKKMQAALAVRNLLAAAEFGGEGRSGSIRRSDNPDVLYGRDFEDEPIPLEQIVEEMGEVTVRGKILNMGGEGDPWRTYHCHPDSVGFYRYHSY